MKLKNKIFFFFFVLSFFILIFHFIGFLSARGDWYSREPQSWTEILHSLWLYVIMASIITFFASKVYIMGKEQEKRDMDAARKRIEERERKEKEESQEKVNKDSDKSEDEKL